MAPITSVEGSSGTNPPHDEEFASTNLDNVPCAACGWTIPRQTYCNYESHIKITYACADRAVWTVGDRLVIKERSTTGANFEVVNTDFIQKHTSLPIPSIVDSWDDNGRSFIVSKRVRGQSLDKVWSSLTCEDKERIARQTAAYLAQLRSLQSTRLECRGGKSLFSAWLFDDAYNAHGPFSSDQDFWEELRLGLKGMSKRSMEKLAERMPPCQPYTFSHNDLAMVNIMVDEGNLAAIIDWESSGYFPVWWEYAFAQLGFGAEDKAWKNLLRKHMEPHEAGSKFYHDLITLRRKEHYPEEYAQLITELSTL